MRFKITVEDKRKEGVPLFTLMTSIGSAILAALATMIGITAYEQRVFLTIIATLLFWNIVAILYSLDRAVRLHFYSQELYYRYIRRIARERDKAVERAKAKREEIDQLQAKNEQLERDLREARRDLEERERQLGAAQRHIQTEAADKEALRAEAQRVITGLKEQIEALMKTQGQSLTEYALIVFFIVLVCIGLLAQIGLFPLSVFTQLVGIL